MSQNVMHRDRLLILIFNVVVTCVDGLKTYAFGSGILQFGVYVGGRPQLKVRAEL